MRIRVRFRTHFLSVQLSPEISFTQFGTFVQGRHLTDEPGSNAALRAEVVCKFANNSPVSYQPVQIYLEGVVFIPSGWGVLRAGWRADQQNAWRYYQRKKHAAYPTHEYGAQGRTLSGP